MLAFLCRVEKTHRAIGMVNFVGILQGVENNSVQKEMLAREGLSKAIHATCHGSAC